MNAIAVQPTSSVKLPPVNEPRNATAAAPGKPPRIPVSPERIRIRAFEIYLTRNGGPGDEMTDWLQAERELATAAEMRVSPSASDVSPAIAARRP